MKARGPAAPPAHDPAHLEACRRGDRAALERVFREHGPMLHRLLVRLLGSTVDADDVLQITVVNAMRAFPTFRGEASLETWLSRIAVNAARSHMRSARTPMRATLELVDEPNELDPGPDRIVQDRQRLERLHHHLRAIGPAKRIAFVLHVVQGLPVEEVAALTGTAVFATKSRIYWAGRALRARARRDPLLSDLLEPTDGGE